LEANQAAGLASSDGGLVVGMAGDLVSAPFEGKIDNLSIFARNLGSVDVYNWPNPAWRRGQRFDLGGAFPSPTRWARPPDA
jgi:hypothetical protein